MPHHLNLKKRKELYYHLCLILNTLCILLLTAGSGVLLYYLGMEPVGAVAISFVLFWGYAWLQQHYLSRFINVGLGKWLRVDEEE